MKIATMVAAGLLLSGCAGMSRIAEYHGKEDAKVTSEGTTYKIWVHKRDHALLMQKGIGAMLAGGATQGATFGMAGPDGLATPWRAAANVLLKPVGCEANKMTDLSQHLTWEAAYSCPAGTDFRAIMAAQRDALRRGEPIRPQP